MVEGGTMKPTPSRTRSRRTTEDRAALLLEFQRSGLSGSAFARKHGLGGSTFYHWLRQARTTSPPAFIEVDLPPALTTEGLVIELSPAARLRLTSRHQIALAAQLLQTLQAPLSC